LSAIKWTSVTAVNSLEFTLPQGRITGAARIDARTGQILCPIRPLDKAANADALRRRLDPVTTEQSAMPAAGIAPLLKQMMADYAATGLPPAYLPTSEKDDAV